MISNDCLIQLYKSYYIICYISTKKIPRLPLLFHALGRIAANSPVDKKPSIVGS